MKEKKYTKVPITINSVSDEENSLWATFSTSDIDRHGEEVSQNWLLESFLKNPVVLNSHQYGDIEEVIGRVEVISQKEDSLEGKIKFAVKENPKAKVAFQLYKGGFLNAFSVGFIPGEEANELLELSAVSVPANAMALAKSKGIDVDILKEQPEDDERPLDGTVTITTENYDEILGSSSGGLHIDNTTGGGVKISYLSEEETDEGGNTEEEVKDPQVTPQDATEPSDEELDRQIEEKTQEIREMFQKEGRVLSSANRKKVEEVIKLLQQLLVADSKSKENKIKDSLRELDKVVTRLKKQDDRAKKKREINKTIRNLIKERQKI